jgi:hypothetical protein
MSAVKVTLTYDLAEYIAEIAKVESTMLGPEDHGIWTAQLHLTGMTGGWGQSAGGFSLDEPQDGARRRGTAFGMDQIIAIVETLGCGDWEHAAGTRCLVLREKAYSQIVGIADLSGERVLIFREHASDFDNAAVTS